MALEINESHKKLGGKSAKNIEWENYGEEILEYMGLSHYDFETLKDNILELAG